MLGRRTPIYAGLVMLSACASESTHVAVDDVDVGMTSDELIYGTDDRLEYGQVVGTEFERWANSAAGLVSSASVACNAGTCALSAGTWTTFQGTRLCNTVAYRGQPRLPSCTGFLVAPNLLVTAAHCMDAADCSTTRFVFGFAADQNGENVPTAVPESNVYSCSSVVDSGATADWQLIRLDRTVSGNRPPLPVRYTGAVANGTPLAVVGHPNGLPLKVSPIGEVTGVTATNTFSHNVETFGGNSGSPVIDSETGVVEGIHVTPPASHFVQSTDSEGVCMAARVCPTTGCPGFSGATRITLASPQIPLTPAVLSVII